MAQLGEEDIPIICVNRFPRNFKSRQRKSSQVDPNFSTEKLPTNKSKEAVT